MQFEIIEDDYILKSEAMTWTAKKLIEKKEYHLCESIEADEIHEDENLITLTRYNNTIRVSLGLECSMKAWNHLFNLPSWITVQENVVNSIEELEVFDCSIEDPNNMFILYGFTSNDSRDLAPIIERAENTATLVKRKTLEELVQHANEIL